MYLINHTGRLLFFTIQLSILVTGCNNSLNDSSWKTVIHKEYGFSIDHPSRWYAQTFSDHGSKGDEEVKLDVYASVWGDL
jgi:hypothetical protein